MTPDSPTPPSERRTLHKSRSFQRAEAKDLLQSALAIELLAPSPYMWLVTPWISNLPVLDNTTGAYSTINPWWGLREVQFSEVIAHFLTVGSTVHLALRDDPHNRTFLAALTGLHASSNALDRLVQHSNNDLHTKSFLTDHWWLSGSMNFTYRGVEENEEMLTFEVNAETLAQQHLHHRERWGRP